MLRLYPESLHAINEHGWLPIHNAAEGRNTKAIDLLLMHDPSAASKMSTGEKSELPLHLACDTGREHVETVKALFDAYPEAILTRDSNGRSPIDIARVSAEIYSTNTAVVSFLEAQLECSEKAQDAALMNTPNKHGWLPLHCALKNNVTLGSIKLLLRGNPFGCADS